METNMPEKFWRKVYPGYLSPEVAKRLSDVIIETNRQQGAVKARQLRGDIFVKFITLQMSQEGGRFIARRLFEMVDELLPNNLKILPLDYLGAEPVRQEGEEPGQD
jgi:hypothetical protein